MTLYLIGVSGVEPSVFGPYKSQEERDKEAIRIHQGQDEDEFLFLADVSPDGELALDTYSASFFMVEEDEESEN